MLPSTRNGLRSFTYLQNLPSTMITLTQPKLSSACGIVLPLHSTTRHHQPLLPIPIFNLFAFWLGGLATKMQVAKLVCRMYVGLFHIIHTLTFVFSKMLNLYSIHVRVCKLA